MKHVSRISEIKSAGSYEYNGAVINVLEITSSNKLKGVCKLQDGTEFNFTNGASNLLYRIDHAGKCKPRTKAGKETSAHIPAKVDNSQSHGNHKVLSVTQSSSKQQKRFLKAYKLCKQASEVYGLTDVFSGILEQLQKLDNYVTNCEIIKAQQAIELAKAEAKAKAEAEAKAKAEAARIEAQRQMVELAAKNAGISIEEAEKNLRALGMIK